MNQKKTVAYFGMLLVLVSGFAYAQGRPKRNVSAALHPNIAAAQRLVAQAFTKISDAQAANEWDLGGHAKRAKELLDQADNELKQAAEASNRR